MTAAKAWVAATITFLAALVAAKWGFNVPIEIQTAVISALMAAASGFFTWLIPNQTA